MSECIRTTRSVCPVCLKNLPAELVRDADGIYMEKECPEHGAFRTIVWRDCVSFEDWRGSEKKMPGDVGTRCPADCGHCTEHEQGSCCVLLEVTRKCNLRCRFCFAEGTMDDPSMDELKRAVDRITAHGKPLIQLSGGEPSLRNDLPELIAYIRSRGVRYVQLNSNGLRLAEDEAYVASLAKAGLSFVFMQFDGVDDTVYEALRGRPLLETKTKAIEVCGRYGLGVTLVPTVVRGVNENQIGDIIRFGAKRSPVVRGVHFQPVSYFGRYDSPADENAARYTLDELILSLRIQAGIPEKNISPSHCDHPGCGFHASFMVTGSGNVLPLTTRSAVPLRVSAEKNRKYIGSRWERNAQAEEESACCGDPDKQMRMDDFLIRAKSHSFTVTAMAFQDAMNLDVERLRRCSLHVYDSGVLKPFCARYLTPVEVE